MKVREVARGGVHEGDHGLQVLVPTELLREGPHTLEGVGAEVAIMKDRQAISCLNQLCLEVREPIDRLQGEEASGQDLLLDDQLKLGELLRDYLPNEPLKGRPLPTHQVVL
jgi:hypothetical protein